MHQLFLAFLPAFGLVMYARHRQARRKLAIAEAAVCEPCEPSSEDTQPGRKRLGHDPPCTPELSESITKTAARTPRAALLGVDKSPRHYVGLTKDSAQTTRRDNYIEWHDYFMSVAMLSAFRSKDPSRQVGACIVDPATKRIVGIGYNGLPWGCSDEVLPWARKADSWLDTKYPYVCHAELNAIMNKNSASLEGCRMYTTLFPCNECAKLIVQSRICEVVYLSDAQRNTDPNTASRRILDLAGVVVWQQKPAVRQVIIDFEDDLAR